MIAAEELLERLNPWVAMPVGLRLPGMKDTDQVTRLKRLCEVLDEMQEQQLVPRDRAWMAVMGITDIRRMLHVAGEVLAEIEGAHSVALDRANSDGFRQGLGE